MEVVLNESRNALFSRCIWSGKSSNRFRRKNFWQTVWFRQTIWFRWTFLRWIGRWIISGNVTFPLGLWRIRLSLWLWLWLSLWRVWLDLIVNIDSRSSANGKQSFYSFIKGDFR